MSRLLVPAFLLAATAVPALATPGHVHGGSCRAYTVARHDTLYSIARYCRSSVAAVARASHLADARRIAVGQRLHVPGAPLQREAGKVEDGPGPAAMPLTYSFADGDTLYSLARWSGVSLAALMAANPGIDPQKIELGDPIRLPAGAVPPEPARERERGRVCLPHRERDHDGDRDRGPDRDDERGPMHRDRDRMGPDRDRMGPDRDRMGPDRDRDHDRPPPPRHGDKPDEDDGPAGM